MAGMEYVKCENCAVRLVHDPEQSIDYKIVCYDCYQKLEKKLKN